MENRNVVIFVKEANEIMFQSSLQHIFNDYSDGNNIEVQYQYVNDVRGFYTALVIIRRK